MTPALSRFGAGPLLQAESNWRPHINYIKGGFFTMNPLPHKPDSKSPVFLHVYRRNKQTVALANGVGDHPH